MELILCSSNKLSNQRQTLGNGSVTGRCAVSCGNPDCFVSSPRQHLSACFINYCSIFPDPMRNQSNQAARCQQYPTVNSARDLHAATTAQAPRPVSIPNRTSMTASYFKVRRVLQLTGVSREDMPVCVDEMIPLAAPQSAVITGASVGASDCAHRCDTSDMEHGLRSLTADCCSVTLPTHNTGSDHLQLIVVL
jgi:hypothetical protein